MNARLGAAAAAVAVLALAGCGSGSAPIPQASKDCTAAGVTCTHDDPAPGAIAAPTETQPAADPAPTETQPAAAPASTPSTCDIAREATLTGTPSDVTAAMAALVADKTAPATAREYAQYYSGRDAGNKQMQTMDVELIRMSCTA
jgi:hypothetical protein